MPYLTMTDKTELYVKDWGSGRPVILLHGWPLSSDSWDDQAMAIADAGYRAISYDRRGFGRSSQPWSGYDYNTLADDLASVIEQTGAKDATLVGFSMGGGEVARYMTRHRGNQVKRAVLVSSVVPYMRKTGDNPDGVDGAVFDEMLGAIERDRAKFWSGFFKDFFGVSLVSHPVSVEVLEWACRVSMQAGLHPTLAGAKAFANTDFRSDLASFKLPTLVIHGNADKTVPINTAGRKAAQGIAHAQFIEYDGAPHGLFASHKDRLATDVLAFLRS